MPDTTIIEVDSSHSPHGAMGQRHLASGARVSMRLWNEVELSDDKAFRERAYEAVGYVVRGRAELHVDGQKAILEPGDSWVVPASVEHRYRIVETFTAVEATSPPAEIEGRDEKPG